MTEEEKIADLERRIETFKVIQRTNDASIKMWQELHQKDQRCLIHMAKRLNHVTAQNVRLKKDREDLEKMLLDDAINSIEQAAQINEDKEFQAIFESLD